MAAPDRTPRVTMKIALTLDRDADLSESNDYLQSLVRAGIPREAIAVVTPDSSAPEAFDALVLGGGVDVDPARYGRDRLENGTVEVDPGRDSLDFELLERASRAGAPVLGICRGLQVVNVARGGTLVQDIPHERPSEVVHQRTREERTRMDHAVRPAPGTRLSEIVGASEFPVNSRHHQAIEKLGGGLRISGVAPDGVPEAIEASGPAWLVAVQWHPENLQDPVSLALFREFARVVREGSAPRAEGEDGAGARVPAAAEREP
jgi:putative glutamine amidotransferase